MISVIATPSQAPDGCATKVSNATSARARVLGKDRRGSIEGLPLYFLVSALVVAVATSALLSMMGGLQGQTIGAVTLTPDTVSVAGGAGRVTFTATVLDTDGNPIEGAIVSATGLGASAAAKTDDAGKVRFSLTVDLGNSAFGEIEVEATHHGPAGEGQRSASLLVTRG